jgi:hypothetical protein
VLIARKISPRIPLVARPGYLDSAFRGGLQVGRVVRYNQACAQFLGQQNQRLVMVDRIETGLHRPVTTYNEIIGFNFTEPATYGFFSSAKNLMAGIVRCYAQGVFCVKKGSSSPEWRRILRKGNRSGPSLAPASSLGEALTSALLPETAKRALIQPLLDAFVQITHSRSPQLNQSLTRGFRSRLNQ